MLKKYYEEVDALKGFAIFMVILAHSIIVYPINLHENKFCLELFNSLTCVHMLLFFMISGFCFSFEGG